MNIDFLKEFGRQLLSIWKGIKLYQKFTVIIVCLSLLLIFGVLIFSAAVTQYAPLFPAERLTLSDASEVKNYLESAGISYKIKGERSVFVPQESIHRLRMDLAAIGLPKADSGKGFELFDSNTWIKGEKELQILEMRALRGQLENDIASYDNIKSAKVMLDIAPPRPFGGTVYKTKASIILDLMPGARLNQSQLRAISYHISGAVRGLVPNMVAISDTAGRLYQSIDPEGEMDLLRGEEVALEERIHAKVSGLLGMIVGHDNFYCTVQVVMKREKTSQERKIFSGIVDGVDLGESVPVSITEVGAETKEEERSPQGIVGTTTEAFAGAEDQSGDMLNRSEKQSQQYQQMAVPVNHLKVTSKPGQLKSVSIGVMIDKTITIDSNADLPEDQLVQGQRNAELIREEVHNQLKKILEGYNVKTEPAIDFVEFDKTKYNQQEAKESFDQLFTLGVKVATGLFIFVLALGMFWTFHRFWKKHMEHPPDLEGVESKESDLRNEAEPSLIEVEAMVDVIKARVQKDPSIVASTIREWLMLDKNRAKEE